MPCHPGAGWSGGLSNKEFNNASSNVLLAMSVCLGCRSCTDNDHTSLDGDRMKKANRRKR